MEFWNNELEETQDRLRDLAKMEKEGTDIFVVYTDRDFTGTYMFKAWFKEEDAKKHLIELKRVGRENVYYQRVKIT